MESWAEECNNEGEEVAGTSAGARDGSGAGSASFASGARPPEGSEGEEPNEESDEEDSMNGSSAPSGAVFRLAFLSNEKSANFVASTEETGRTRGGTAGERIGGGGAPALSVTREGVEERGGIPPDPLLALVLPL